MTMNRFKDNDLVVLKSYEELCKINHISESNERYKRHYNYIKSKEPLKISYFYEPGELTYSDECDDLSLRGKPTKEYMYDIQTPRSKLYLFSDDELEPYIEDKPDTV